MVTERLFSFKKNFPMNFSVRVLPIAKKLLNPIHSLATSMISYGSSQLHKRRGGGTALFHDIHLCSFFLSACIFLLLHLYKPSFQSCDYISKSEEFVVIHYERSCVSQMACGYHKIVGKAQVTGMTASESWMRLYLVSFSL